MPTANEIKNERIEFRVSSEMKALIQQAASIQGVSTSDFLAATAYREAKKTIEEHEIEKKAKGLLSFCSIPHSPMKPYRN
jgi:uncharacterized protein (DUF1778 family)